MIPRLTRITGINRQQHDALEAAEEGFGLALCNLTATTATFVGSPALAIRRLDEVMERLGRSKNSEARTMRRCLFGPRRRLWREAKASQVPNNAAPSGMED